MAPASPAEPAMDEVSSNMAAPAPAPVTAAAPAPATVQGYADVPPQREADQLAGSVEKRDAAKASLGPDDRVGEIRRLLGRGDRDGALRELKALRERYPHYDLPQDLRDLTP